MPEKTEAERTLELVERGKLDREARQQAEDKAEADAAQTERLRVYHERYNAAVGLVDQYEHKAEAFDRALGELAGIVEAMSQLTRAIETERTWLAPESRAMGDMRGLLTYDAKDVAIEVRRAVARAWQRGQQT